MLLRIIYIFCTGLTLVSCKKFVTVERVEGRYLVPQAFSSDSVANSAIAGIYREWKSYYNSIASPSILAGLSADELKIPSQSSPFTQYYKNEISPTNPMLPWARLYNIIYQTNLSIESLNRSDGLSGLRKNYYLGEARFIRANSYFHLVNIFGGVPLLLSSDIDSNSIARRATVPTVYGQILLDLAESEILMKDQIFPPEDRERLNIHAVRSFLSRVHLYLRNWPAAKGFATSVIESGKFKLETDLKNVFKTGSQESIFQFANSKNDGMHEVAAFSLLTDVSLSDSFLNAFQSNDLRRRDWTQASSNQSSYPFKYTSWQTSNNQSYTLFRLAEQYLIRAEANVHLKVIDSAIDDLNVLRVRAGLPELSDHIDDDSCLKTIFKERRYELFAETGHRWFDLKRSNNIKAVISLEKGNLWMDSDSLYPIPEVDIQRNPNLQQNLNY